MNRREAIRYVLELSRFEERQLGMDHGGTPLRDHQWETHDALAALGVLADEIDDAAQGMD